ncbi:MAG: DEAD/DEAH box helicase [Candidatus Eremiobacteraeota bacterium]|nr:DEAD/DEAH box helicase [Candidatus Eremiobacteraeota bacterium]
MKKFRSTSKSSAKAKPSSTTSTPNTPARKKSTKALPPPTPSEAAFERAFAALVAGDGSAPASAELGDFVRRAFAKSAEYARDPYSTIGDATVFHTNVVGVTFEGRQDVIKGLRAGFTVDLVRDPHNPQDPNAIEVRYGNLQVGFIKRGMAAHLAPAMDEGARYRARIEQITGGTERAKSLGVNLFVERDLPATLQQGDRDRSAARAAWDGDARRIREALIGANEPHDAQRAVLDRVERGKNTLAVLGTGRGKSFCFQFTAALRAFAGAQKTLVVYPLRALANDQYEALMRKLDPLGLRVYRANGSIENAERAALFEALAEGAWDVMLATPEFLDFHRNAFTGSSRPALLVIDEAHHVYESRHRPAYARLRSTIATLGNPQVLALTATAGDDAFRKIVDEFGIEAWVIDPTVRENLSVVDARGRDKIEYLLDVFRSPGKGIVYANSRTECGTVADRLRKEFGDEVMFYHAGMPTADRHEVERYFREGALRIVVATTAFGEGIDLPDVRHVVLYHLNFDVAEFNQQAGRAGRDGAPAEIHLLYGEKDRRINDFLIDLDAPSLSTLRELYRGMRGMARDGVLRRSNADISATLELEKVRDRTVAAALRIFNDSNLVEIGEDDEGRYVRFLPVDGKVDMERNERFAEGQADREAFDRFSTTALTAPAESLERIINRPIYPGRIEHLR